MAAVFPRIEGVGGLALRQSRKTVSSKDPSAIAIALFIDISNTVHSRRRSVGVSTMSTMIKLRLPESVRDLDSVQALAGLADLKLDSRFGLVPLDPRNSLYAVRTDAVDNLDQRRRLSPEIIEAYGDVKIGRPDGFTESETNSSSHAPPRKHTQTRPMSPLPLFETKPTIWPF
jgi:hypothetical protein